MNTILHSAKTRLIVKALCIGFISIIMLIPLSMISDLINERKSLADDAVQEVGNSWSQAQTVSGPVLSVQGTLDENTVFTHFLPQELRIEGSLSHQELKRGIYPVQVYNSLLKMSGSFRIPATALAENQELLLGKLTLSLGISDLRGIGAPLSITLCGQELALSSGLDPIVSTQGLTATLPTLFCQDAQAGAQEGVVLLPFTIELPLKGSQSIRFVPVGKMNHIKLEADYASPKFYGNYLPEERTITGKGFSARWEIPYLTRNYSQQLSQADWFSVVAPSAFGVDLLDSISPYRQANRSIKYAILVIVLTFVMVFFTDQRAGNRINVFHYLLAALALVLFYSLLIALSEVLAFPMAYALSALLTVILLTLYLQHLLANKKYSLYLGALLSGIYLFVYILLQMENYALLAGTLGLFLILAGVMRLSTKTNL